MFFRENYLLYLSREMPERLDAVEGQEIAQEGMESQEVVDKSFTEENKTFENLVKQLSQKSRIIKDSPISNLIRRLSGKLDNVDTNNTDDYEDLSDEIDSVISTVQNITPDSEKIKRKNSSEKVETTLLKNKTKKPKEVNKIESLKIENETLGDISNAKDYTDSQINIVINRTSSEIDNFERSLDEFNKGKGIFEENVNMMEGKIKNLKKPDQEINNMEIFGKLDEKENFIDDRGNIVEGITIDKNTGVLKYGDFGSGLKLVRGGEKHPNGDIFYGEFGEDGKLKEGFIKKVDNTIMRGRFEEDKFSGTVEYPDGRIEQGSFILSEGEILLSSGIRKLTEGDIVIGKFDIHMDFIEGSIINKEENTFIHVSLNDLLVFEGFRVESNIIKRGSFDSYGTLTQGSISTEDRTETGYFDSNEKLVRGERKMKNGEFSDGLFGESGEIVVGVVHKLYPEEIRLSGEFNDQGKLIYGNRENKYGDIESGSFDPDSGIHIEGHFISKDGKVYEVKNSEINLEGKDKNEIDFDPIINEVRHNHVYPNGSEATGIFDINTGNLLAGTIKYNEGATEEGIFDPINLSLLVGEKIDESGFTQKGFFDKENGKLKLGEMSDETGSHMKGLFDRDSGHLIQGESSDNEGSSEKGFFDRDSGHLVKGERLGEGPNIHEDDVVMNVSENGTFDKENGNLIDGKRIYGDGTIEEGKFDPTTENLIEGKLTIIGEDESSNIVMEGRFDRISGEQIFGTRRDGERETFVSGVSRGRNNVFS